MNGGDERQWTTISSRAASSYRICPCVCSILAPASLCIRRSWPRIRSPWLGGAGLDQTEANGNLFIRLRPPSPCVF